MAGIFNKIIKPTYYNIILKEKFHIIYIIFLFNEMNGLNQ